MLRRTASTPPALLLLLVAACSRSSPPEGPSALAWTVVQDVEHLRRELDRARAEGRPAVVNLTAAWCGPCQLLDRYIAETPPVRQSFEQAVRLRIDVTRQDEPELRAAVGIQRGTPQMLFFQKNGQVLTDLHLLGWDPRRGPRVLEVALARIR